MPWKTLSYPVKSPSLLLICRQTGLGLSFRSLLIVRHFCEIFPFHFSGQSRLDGLFLMYTYTCAEHRLGMVLILRRIRIRGYVLFRELYIGR